MAKDFSETRRFDGGPDDLWQAAIEGLTRAGQTIKSADRATNTIVARTSWISLKGGGEKIIVQLLDGALSCSSRMWSPVAITDYGKNRANVQGFFDSVGSVLSGTAAPPRKSIGSWMQDGLSTVEARFGASDAPAPPRSPAHQPPPPPTAAPSPIPAELVVEQLETLEQVVETIDIDDFPVDNSHGAAELVLEHEFRHTVKAGVSLENEHLIGGQLGPAALGFVTGHLKAHAQRTYGLTEETEITRSYKATFRVKEHESVLYRISWKRRSYPGRIELSAGPNRLTIPFNVVSDLEYGVSTHPIEGR